MKPVIRSKGKIQPLLRRMKNHKYKIILILFLYPNIVCFTPERSDSSNTFIDFLMGIGSYSNVLEGCSINRPPEKITNYSYIDYGGSFSHKMENLKFGIRGGGFSLTKKNVEFVSSVDRSGLGEQSVEGSAVQYINPFIAFDHKCVEISFGLLFLTKYPSNWNIPNNLLKNGTTQFSWLLRIGNKQSFHFSSQFLNNVPLFSGGGILDLGFGFNFGSRESRTLSWLGLSLGPYQNLGLGLKQSIQISDNVDVLIKGRLGENDSRFEGSISAGARYNF